VIIPWARSLQLRDQLLGACVLDVRFVHQIVIFDRRTYRRIENLFFYGGLDGQRGTDLLHKVSLLLLHVVTFLKFLESAKHRFHFPVVVHEQLERVGLRRLG
jgi:hypothetical protein